MGDSDKLKQLKLAAAQGELGNLAIGFVEHNITKLHEGTTALHVAMLHGQFESVPKSVLTAWNLILLDGSGQTPLRLMSRHGGLSILPEPLLLELMLRPNEKDTLMETPLHDAAAFGYLHELPKSVLTVENLLIEGFTKTTPLYYATKCGTLSGKSSEMELLLGLDFPIAVKYVVGDNWWEKNEQFKKSVADSKNGLHQADPDNSLDIF